MTYPATDPAVLRSAINRSLVRALAQECGYVLPDERVIRIATEVDEMIARGYPAAWAFAEALDDEIVLHGLS